MHTSFPRTSSGRATAALLAGSVLAAAFAACDPGATHRRARAAPDSAIDTELRDELIRLGMADQTVRLGFDAETGADTARLRIMLSVDSSLTARLRRIVAERGWPGISLVGKDAAKAAFLIVQHSPSDGFQRDMLPPLEAAAAAGEAAAADVAMLTDRVRTHEGRPQLYGTQFRIVEGALEAYPIEDPDSLDARRARVGLLPMAEYIRLLASTYGGEIRLSRPDSSAGAGSG
jgi:hypothetical protein